MKALNIMLLVFVVLAVGCKTQKIASKPEPINSESTAKTQTSPVKSSNVNLKEERVTAAKGEASDLGTKRFYIIMGSYSVNENAQKFKKQLMSEDFFPGILINESGLYRISVNSYDDEATARARIAEIRQKYPKYSDVWLLVKKQ
jgi:cell division protein FtsN